MEPDTELRAAIRRRLEAAHFIRWCNALFRDEGREGGPEPGWEREELRRAVRLLAAHNGLDER